MIIPGLCPHCIGTLMALSPLTFVGIVRHPRAWFRLVGEYVVHLILLVYSFVKWHTWSVSGRPKTAITGTRYTPEAVQELNTMTMRVQTMARNATNELDQVEFNHVITLREWRNANKIGKRQLITDCLDRCNNDLSRFFHGHPSWIEVGMKFVRK